jgi:hypothetical protein
VGSIPIPSSNTEFPYSNDILYVKELLGHVNTNNTLVYTHFVNFASEEFVCKIAKTAEEASKLIESGFEYVCRIED